jgi:hypothetical protein
VQQGITYLEGQGMEIWGSVKTLVSMRNWYSVPKWDGLFVDPLQNRRGWILKGFQTALAMYNVSLDLDHMGRVVCRSDGERRETRELLIYDCKYTPTSRNRLRRIDLPLQAQEVCKVLTPTAMMGHEIIALPRWLQGLRPVYIVACCENAIVRLLTATFFTRPRPRTLSNLMQGPLVGR